MMKIEFLKSVKAMKKTAQVGDVWDVPPQEAMLLVQIKAAKIAKQETPVSPMFLVDSIEQTQIEKKGKKKK